MTYPDAVPASVDQRSAFSEALEATAGLAVPPCYSEDALALRFAERHSTSLRFVPAWKAWLHWDGTHWQKDETLRTFDLVRELCREAAADCPDERAAMQIASAKTVAAVERLARADRRFASGPAQWDEDDWLLNTPDSVVDLRTGSPQPHRQEHYMTKITSVGPGGECPQWLTFLNFVTAGDDELIAFLRRMFGYCLTGVTTEQCLFFLHGKGGNGKTVLVNTLRGILAGYHKTAPTDTFAATDTRHTRQHGCNR